MGVFQEPEVFLFACWKAVNEKSKTGDKVGEIYQDGLLSARSGYATYRGGENYSELKTDGYEIIHDLAK